MVRWRSILLALLALAMLDLSVPTAAEAQLGSLLRGASRAGRGARAAGSAARAGGHAAGSLGRGARGLRGLRGPGGRGLATLTAAAALHAEPRAFALFRSLPDDLPRATYLTADGMGGYRAIGSEAANAGRFGTSAGDALQGVHSHGTAIVIDLPAAATPEVLSDLHGPLYVLDAAGEAHPIRRAVGEAGETRYVVDVPSNRGRQAGDGLAGDAVDGADGVGTQRTEPAQPTGMEVDGDDPLETLVDLAETAAEAAAGDDPQQDQPTQEPQGQDLAAFALEQIESLPPLALPAYEPSNLSAPEESSAPMVLGILAVVGILGLKGWLFLRKSS